MERNVLEKGLFDNFRFEKLHGLSLFCGPDGKTYKEGEVSLVCEQTSCVECFFFFFFF